MAAPGLQNDPRPDRVSCRRHAPLAIPYTSPHPCPPAVRQRVLTETTCFSPLSQAELAELHEHFTARAYAADSMICRAGDPARELFVLGAGRVKLTRSTSVGDEVLVDVVLPGAMFGALPGNAQTTYAETARTLTGCCALAIPVSDFGRLMRAHPDVALAVVGSLTDQVSRARAALVRLGNDPVDQRIAGTLLSLAARAGHERPGMTLLQIPLSRADLAAMCATTPESVSRTLSRWRRQGVIDAGRRWIGIEDFAALRALAEGRSPRT